MRRIHDKRASLNDVSHWMDSTFRVVADKTEVDMSGMHAVNVLLEQGRIAWAEEHRGWVAAPEDVVSALTNDGFEEYKRELLWTRSGELAAGIWQGLNLRTGAVASAIWVNRSDPNRAVVFLHIDGEPVAGGRDG